MIKLIYKQEVVWQQTQCRLIIVLCVGGIQVKEFNCGYCIQHLIGHCDYSPGSAACIYSRKDWRNEPKEKVDNYVDALEKWEISQLNLKYSRIRYQIKEEREKKESM